MEDELLPISALQHLVFCERRAALVHIERLWGDNLFTAEGALIHDRPDSGVSESRVDVRVSRGLLIRSLALGLSGKADVVEFIQVPVTTDAGRVGPPQRTGITLAGVHGYWRPFPVEYKRGALRHERGYEVQLCAQALCLEEMLCTSVPAGALYFAQPRRRLEVLFDDPLRTETGQAAARLREVFERRRTPPPRYGPKCHKCSMVDWCMPKAVANHRSVGRYLARAISSALNEEADDG